MQDTGNADAMKKMQYDITNVESFTNAGNI